MNINGHNIILDYIKLNSISKKFREKPVWRNSFLHTGLIEDPSSRGADNGPPEHSSRDGQEFLATWLLGGAHGINVIQLTALGSPRKLWSEFCTFLIHSLILEALLLVTENVPNLLPLMKGDFSPHQFLEILNLEILAGHRWSLYRRLLFPSSIQILWKENNKYIDYYNSTKKNFSKFNLCLVIIAMKNILSDVKKYWFNLPLGNSNCCWSSSSGQLISSGLSSSSESELWA